MLEPDNPEQHSPASPTAKPPVKAPRTRSRAKKTAGTAEVPQSAPNATSADSARNASSPQSAAEAPESTVSNEAPARSPRRRTARKSVDAATAADTQVAAVGTEASVSGEPAPPRPTRRRSAKKAAAEAAAPEPPQTAPPAPTAEVANDVVDAIPPTMVAPSVLFVAPASAPEAPARRRRRATKATQPDAVDGAAAVAPAEQPVAAALEAAEAVLEAAEAVIEEPEEVREIAAEEATGARRRRRRGRRGRGRRDADEITDAVEAPDGTPAGETPAGDESTPDEDAESPDTAEAGTSTASRRRRRRRRKAGDNGDEAAGRSEDDPPDTVVHVRDSRAREAEDDNGDGVRGVRGSTRLEAKRQRRREGRDSGRRRAPILTEAEFLARREAVDRTMAVRDLGDRTQIAVLEDGVLVEHYVTRASATSYVGNVYLGRVQNVLPSMEAAFVDIGKGRNGVLYAGEVNWDAAGLEGKSRAIENALKSGDTILAQVTKDPVGHKGARLTSQISLPGRFLVYVPGGGMTGISRKLPDTERHRLKSILKKIVPEDAGVIIRTAAEGATEEELTRDVERLTAQWAAIQDKAAQSKSAPVLVYGEPDLAIRVVRDVFNEDFDRLIVQGDQAWSTVSSYVADVAPDLRDRVSQHTGDGDLFHELRVDEQLIKALSRKVFLPSGGSLVIDRTEAMTVIDVNTGKFIGAGGNLEQTVTRNNLEAAEEIVRQLRLRDIGGIIVIDFIDMVLESNRDLVHRRLIECLGRDRTKHQVAEVTSLGLVQMTRKRVGEGLLEAFSETCPTCGGRGVIIHDEPVDDRRADESSADEGASKGTRRRRGQKSADAAETATSSEQRRAAASAMAAIAAKRDDFPLDQGDVEPTESDVLAPDGPHAEPSADAATADGVATAIDLVTPDASRPAGEGLPTAAESATAAESPADVAAESNRASSESTTDGSSRAPRRRGRRSATRPAGPPVPVG
jgi:ribonuclease E